MKKLQFSDGIYEVKKGDMLINKSGFATIVVSTWAGLRTSSGFIPKEKVINWRKVR